MVVSQSEQVFIVMSLSRLVLHVKKEKIYFKLLSFGDQGKTGCNFYGCNFYGSN